MVSKKAFKYKKPRSKLQNILLKLSIFLISLILASIYLFYTWTKYQGIADEESIEQAKSISSLLHVEHMKMLISDNEIYNQAAKGYVEESLVDLIENTDYIYYAYIFDRKNEKMFLLADSISSNLLDSIPAEFICEKDTKSKLITYRNEISDYENPYLLKCSNWIRAHVPIYTSSSGDNSLFLVLVYSTKERTHIMYKNMISDIIIVLFINLLIFAFFIIYDKNKNLIESERNKSLILSHLPGMAYRCKYDQYWTMEWISEGCYNLTGYRPKDMMNNRIISYRDIISPKYLEILYAEWDRVLSLKKNYSDEYEIITSDKEHKWVLELGQGVYDDRGNLMALEGIILDINDQKLKEYQIENLKDHDLLTGLHNRSFMEDELKRIDKEEFMPLALILCDVDGLAMVNDAYGYEEGDRLIKRAARIIENSIKGDYRLGHLGGGEFLIYLLGVNEEAAMDLKDGIKKRVERYNKLTEDKLYDVSISIGYSAKLEADKDIRVTLKETENYLRRRKLLNQNSYHSAIVSSIMASLYAKSHETEEHGQRMGKFCLMIGRKLNFSQAELDDLQLLSKLHDIGKIGIDNIILNKPDSLDSEEWEVMKTHPEIGYRIAMTTPQLKHIADYILHHHERWDGSGYPSGLRGEEIPLMSRILALADAYDAMTEDRVYREKKSKEEAIEEIMINAGSQFDPQLAQIFVKILKEDI